MSARGSLLLGGGGERQRIAIPRAFVKDEEFVRDPKRHPRAAGAVAGEYFDAPTVPARRFDEAGR